LIYLVCGGRQYKNKTFIYDVLTKARLKDLECIVHGGAEGADQLAGLWAIENGIPEIIVPAAWKYYGRDAGPIRNGWMLKFIKIGHVIAFPGGPGTQNMIRRARIHGIQNITQFQND